jgi:hypothetical protein
MSFFIFLLLYLKKFKFFLFFSLLQINIFLVFSDHLKNKKIYYFNTFPNKNHFEKQPQLYSQTRKLTTIFSNTQAYDTSLSLLI